MKKEFATLIEKREELIGDLDYALRRFNWGKSALDAKAITILNEWENRLIEQDKQKLQDLQEELKEEVNQILMYRSIDQDKKGNLCIPYKVLKEFVDEIDKTFKKHIGDLK